MERYKERQNHNKEEALVNGWVTQTQDFHIGQGIKTIEICFCDRHFINPRGEITLNKNNSLKPC